VRTDQAPDVRTAEDVLAELAQLAEGIALDAQALDAKYARRLAVYQEARALDPPLTFGRVAAAAGVTEVAVIQSLRKLAEADALRAAHEQGEHKGHVAKCPLCREAKAS
jgi:hypothetical protein